MVSLLVLTFVFLIVMSFLANRLGSIGPDEYPDSVGVGGVVIEFSKIDKTCYLVSLLSVLGGVATGIVIVWGPKESELVWKLLGTSIILFLGSMFTLQLNRLMKGSHKSKTQSDSTRKD